MAALREPEWELAPLSIPRNALVNGQPSNRLENRPRAAASANDRAGRAALSNTNCATLQGMSGIGTVTRELPGGSHPRGIAAVE